MNTKRFRSARRPQENSRRLTLESLEDRLTLTTTLFLDFGAGLAAAGLNTTAGAYRDVDGANTGTNMTNGTNTNPTGMNAGDALNLARLAYDFDGNGTGGQVSDVNALAAAVVPLVQRALEPFDINVVIATATSLADVVASLDANNGDATGEFDAYNFVTTFTSGTLVTAGNPTGSVGQSYGLLGRAATIDLGAQTGNNTDEATMSFADRLVAGTPGTPGTALFNQNLAQRVAYTATHEAFHTFSYVHTPDESNSMPAASAFQRLLASGDVIRRGSNTRTNPFMVTRYDLLHLGRAVPEPNNYLLAANDADIGLRDTNGNGTPDFAYSTGTGANDQLTYTDAGGGIVNVAANPYSNQARTLLIGAGESYSIDLANDTDGEILIDAGINADQVIIDATINAAFRARGGVGFDTAVSMTADQDLLSLNSGGLSGTFTPGPDGINGTVSYAGGANVVFTEFEDVDADDVSIDTIVLDLSNGNIVDEGEQFILDVDFINIDTLDSHQILVDWGNGDTSMQTLLAGDRDASFVYDYPDDHPLTATSSDGFTINVTITDDDGDAGMANAGIVVENVAPDILDIALDATSINEADTVTVTGYFGDPALISGATTETWTGTAVWSDGIVTVLSIDSSDGTFSTSRTFLDDHPMTGTPSDAFTVDITINDDDLGTDIATSPILTVHNVAPVITNLQSDATFEDKAEEGEPVNIQASFTDVGILDTHTAVVDWGDGSLPEAGLVNQGAGLGSVTGSHAYDTGGIYDVTLTLTDDDTGEVHSQTIAVVTGVGINNGVLYVVGSNEDDHVSVHRVGKDKIRVHADFVDDVYRTFDLADIDRVIAYLCDGDDHFSMSARVKLAAIVHGGAGNDMLLGGGGPAVLLGDTGDDTLVGKRGRNILIGGAGSDRIVGGGEDDVLIAGSTDIDADDMALIDLLANWNGGDDYDNRVLAIDALLTVTDDGDEDLLTGAAGRDLFYRGIDDIANDAKDNETII